MTILNREFKTRKELQSTIAKLEAEVLDARKETETTKRVLNAVKEVFPFMLGQTVYDVQLRNAKGRYAKKNISLEQSRIIEVVVDEKNYFGLVERYTREDVFLDYESARAFVESVCVKK